MVAGEGCDSSERIFFKDLSGGGELIEADFIEGFVHLEDSSFFSVLGEDARGFVLVGAFVFFVGIKTESAFGSELVVSLGEDGAVGQDGFGCDQSTGVEVPFVSELRFAEVLIKSSGFMSEVVVSPRECAGLEIHRLNS